MSAAQAAAASGNANVPGRPARLQAGGELRAPAIELVEAAKISGQARRADRTSRRDQARSDRPPRGQRAGRAGSAGYDCRRARQRRGRRRGPRIDQAAPGESFSRSTCVGALARVVLGVECWHAAVTPQAGRGAGDEHLRTGRQEEAERGRETKPARGVDAPGQARARPASIAPSKVGRMRLDRSEAIPKRAFGQGSRSVPGSRPAARAIRSPHWSERDNDLTHLRRP